MSIDPDKIAREPVVAVIGPYPQQALVRLSLKRHTDYLCMDENQCPS